MTEANDLPARLELIAELQREWDRRFPGAECVFAADGTIRLDGYFGEDELRWLLEALGRIWAGDPPPALVIAAPACGDMIWGPDGHIKPCVLPANHTGDHWTGVG